MVEVDVVRGVFGGKLFYVFGGALRVGEESKRASVGIRREDADGRFEFLQAVAGELHVFDDLGEWRAAGVGDRGTFESGMKFLGDGGTADDVAAFEDERLVAFFREVEGRNERVVTATENDDVARRGHG
jgi:hypothetical protein